jgi:hypothetical protein
MLCIHAFYCLLQEVPNIYIKIKNCEFRVVLCSATESSSCFSITVSLKMPLLHQYTKSHVIDNLKTEGYWEVKF